VILFQEPLLAELCGAGFTKAPRGKYYELRFPRLTKVYRASSRPWSDGVTIQDLCQIARQSIGRDRSNKDVDDWTKEVWGNVASPGIKCEKRRRKKVVDWVEKLRMIDNSERNKRQKGLDSSPYPSLRGDNDMVVPKGTRNGVDRPVSGLKPLGPILNLLHIPPPPNPVWASPQGVVRRDNFTRLPVSPMRRRLATSSASSLSPFDALFGTKDFAEDSQKLTFLGNHMPAISLPVHPTSNAYSSKSIIKFVQDAFVWFAQPCNAPRPYWRPPIKDLLVGANRVHSLESLLVGCGWEDAVSSRMKFGVIFVDDSTFDGQCWKEYALKTLQERHMLLEPDTKRKRIWVFDAKLLAFDALERTEGDVDGLASWIFD